MLTTPVCDFCGRPKPAWRYEAEPVTLVSPERVTIGVMDSGWLACEPGHERLKAETCFYFTEGFQDTGYFNSYGHDLFFKHRRDKPPTPWNGEPPPDAMEHAARVEVLEGAFGHLRKETVQ